MLDLASRGFLSFREDNGLLSHKVGIDIDPPRGDDVVEAQRRLNQRRPTGPAEGIAYDRLRSLASAEPDGYLAGDKLLEFGSTVGKFDSALEDNAVTQGWFAERPSKVMSRWVVRGVLAAIAGGIALWLGATLPMSGLAMLGGAAIAGGVVMMVFARSMPAVTMTGSMIVAMLHAYKRTLQKTMEQARSMQQVIDEAGLPWLETPDMAVVWGTALGLQGPIEGVLARSLEDVQRGTATSSGTYFPVWYTNSSGTPFASAIATGSGASLWSGSAVPDLGGMMSALGTIGNSPSSSGGGGFGGGGGGGGGGGAGGGF